MPTELGQATQLTKLALNSNRLTGSIATELGSLSRLESLCAPTRPTSDRSDCQQCLRNTRAFWHTSDMMHLHAAHVPTRRHSPSPCRTLDRNELSGTAPSQLGQLSRLSRLYLNENFLGGLIPQQLGQLSKLSACYLMPKGSRTAATAAITMKDAHSGFQCPLPPLLAACLTQLACSGGAQNALSPPAAPGAGIASPPPPYPPAPELFSPPLPPSNPGDGYTPAMSFAIGWKDASIADVHAESRRQRRRRMLESSTLTEAVRT